MSKPKVIRTRPSQTCGYVNDEKMGILNIRAIAFFRRFLSMKYLSRRAAQSGKLGWIFLWLIGISIPILLFLFSPARVHMKVLKGTAVIERNFGLSRCRLLAKAV